MVKKSSGCNKGKSCDCQEKAFDEFLDGVERDLKLDHYQELWNKHRKLISSVGTVLLSALALTFLWQRYEVGQRTEAAGELIRSLYSAQSGKVDESLGIVRFLSTKHLKTYPTLAKFEQAALLAQSDFAKNVDSILFLYKDLMEDSIPAYMKELASILYVRTLMRRAGQEPLDESQAKASLLILKKYRQKPAKGQSVDGLNLLGLEIQGQLYFQLGDLQKARKSFDKISKNKNMPEMMQMRVRLMIQALQDKAGTESPKPAALEQIKYEKEGIKKVTEIEKKSVNKKKVDKKKKMNIKRSASKKTTKGHRGVAHDH